MELLTRARLHAVVAALAVVVQAACGGDDPAGPDDGGDGPMSATIEGRSWVANAPGQQIAAHAGPGLYTIGGGRVDGTSSTVITITLYNIRGTGTYPLGMNATGVGGMATLTENAASWITPLSGAAGTITITELSATKIVATFSFVANSGVGGTGTRTVTNGRLDLPVRVVGTIGPLAESAGSKVSATIGGSAWTASTHTVALVANGALVFTAGNDARTVSVSIAGGGVPGTYALGGTRVIVVSTTTPTASWGGGGSAGSGTLTVTSVTAARVQGTFSATLAPTLGSSTPLVITNGVFDVGRL